MKVVQVERDIPPDASVATICLLRRGDAATDRIAALSGVTPEIRNPAQPVMR